MASTSALRDGCDILTRAPLITAGTLLKLAIHHTAHMYAGALGVYMPSVT